MSGYKGKTWHRVTQHECDERCINARPNSPCSCKCGGANHGLQWLEDSGQDSLFDDEEVNPHD